MRRAAGSSRRCCSALERCAQLRCRGEACRRRCGSPPRTDSLHGSRPWRRCATSSMRSTPGTPTERPPTAASMNAIGLPSFRKRSGLRRGGRGLASVVAAQPASPRPTSGAGTRHRRCRRIPARPGRASPAPRSPRRRAEPPRFSTAAPASAASGCAAATRKLFATTASSRRRMAEGEEPEEKETQRASLHAVEVQLLDDLERSDPGRRSSPSA